MKPLARLFSPIKVGAMEVKNRIVMAPMGNRLSNDDNTVSPALIDYYTARARGGVGLIIMGSTSIDPISPFENMPGIWDDGFIPGLKELVEAVHAHGARIMPQLCHTGWEDRLGATVRPTSLSLEDIEGIVGQFREAAGRAREAGFDGVELHAAHGWMVLGAFRSALRNFRTDAYGGSIEGRTRLLQEVIASLRDAMGPEFPITMRISAEELVPGGHTIRETQYVAPMLVAAGLDALNISAGLHGDAAAEELTTFVPYSRAVKEVVDVPVMVVHRINNPRFAENILERNEADLVLMGRALLADPELPNKAAEGRFEDIAPCIWCGACRSRSPKPVCLVNPALGREGEMKIEAAAAPKKVLVAGGGPAGLKAAAIAAMRGHKVTLCEKDNDLGGQFRLAPVAPGKQEMTRLVQYLRVQAEKAGVEIRLETEVTPETVKEMGPDVVIVATGGEPLVPDVPGAGGERVVTAHDVLAGRVTVGPGNIMIIGGGITGCELADMLADLPDDLAGARTTVTIIEMEEEIGRNIGPEQKPQLMRRLRQKGVRLATSARVTSFFSDGATLDRNGQEGTVHNADSMILAMGVRSVDPLSQEAAKTVPEVHVIGDAKEPRRAVEAIAEGMEIGMSI